MKILLTLLVLMSGTLASLNCILTALLKIYCCPNRASEFLKEYPTGHLVMLGCAADDITDGRWFWNYNGMFTPTTTNVQNCVLGTKLYNNADVLPACSKDTPVLNLLAGKHPYRLDTCDPKYVSNKKFPNQTWFGDDIPWVNRTWKPRSGPRLNY